MGWISKVKDFIMLFRTACNLKLRGVCIWNGNELRFSRQEESGFILMAKKSHQSREWLDQICVLEWCSAGLCGESGREETRLWVGGLSCLNSLSSIGLSTAPHLLGYCPHTLAGAGLDMGVVRTLRAGECSVTSQTSRPSFFFYSRALTSSPHSCQDFNNSSFPEQGPMPQCKSTL